MVLQPLLDGPKLAGAFQNLCSSDTAEERTRRVNLCPAV
jgi:hypothetical protein